MLHNNLFNIEKHLGVTKPVGMSHDEKIRSWNAIEGMLLPHATAFSYMYFWRRTQSRIIAIVLGLLVLGGGATTAFANNAQPGDILFPVAIVGEKAQILFTVDQKTKESLRIKFAEKRLTQIKELRTQSAKTQATGVLATSTNTVILLATTTDQRSYISDESPKKSRTEKAVVVALTELEETRSVLLAKGNADAVSIIDDIIDEITEDEERNLARKGVNSREKMKHESTLLRNTFVATTSATGTFVEQVTLDKKIFTNPRKAKFETTQQADRDQDEEEENDEDDKNKHRNDEGADEEGSNTRGRNEKKITICHLDGTRMETIILGTNAGRAHLAHGDALGTCQ